MQTGVLPIKRPLILIVDDDRFMRVMFEETLKKAGFTTATASDGVAAIAGFQKMQPDLILLDLVMPDIDGCRVCQEIRKTPLGKLTPVLMVTSLEDTDSIDRAFQAGATDFISKTTNPGLLAYRIQYMLRASQSIRALAENEARLANAQRIARLGNWEWNPVNGSFHGSDETFRSLAVNSWTIEHSIETAFAHVNSQERNLLGSTLQEAINNNSECSFEFHVKQTDNELRTVFLQGHPDQMILGKDRRVIGTIQDVTELRQSEDRLSMLKEAVDCLPLGITFCDVNGEIIYSNPAEAKMHGYTINELISKQANQLGPQRLTQRSALEKISSNGLWIRETTNLRKNGEEFPVKLSSIAVNSSKGKCLGMITVCEDITRQKEAEKRIHHLAYYDTLTRLPNRRALLDHMQKALARAKRENRQVGVLFLDLDNFKDINDTHGHAFGDKFLQEVAARITIQMRESDILARLGGDEFVVVLSSTFTQDNIIAVAQRILAIFSEPFEIDSRQVHSSASIGISIYPDDGHDAENLIKCADTAMYEAKREGKAKHCFFTANMNQRILRRIALENGLRNALERQELSLHYQPQWDLQEASIVGVEALVRWQSAEFGALPPSEFIAVAENSGLIIPLGEWILRTACTQAKQWALEGHHNLKVAVNISGQQFRQQDFLKMINTIINETGIDARNLELELTESIIMEDIEKTVNILAALKEIGVQLSIDDFGTGYSSLSYIKHFPIDRVKIDRSFVVDVNHSLDDASIVKAIITMAHSLQLKVVAEGIENRDQLDFMTTHGCDEVQGFYISLPLSETDLTVNLGIGSQ